MRNDPLAYSGPGRLTVIAPGIDGEALKRIRKGLPPDDRPQNRHWKNTYQRMLPPRSAAEINREKTHCPQGHPYDRKNTRYTNRGARVCRICAALRHKRDKERWRAKRLAAAQ